MEAGIGKTYHHCSPSMRNLRKTSSNTVRDQLTSSDTHVVQSDHSTTILCRGDLSNVERNDHCCGANTEANDETANGHLSQRVRGSLENSADDEEKASHINCALSSKAISCEPSSDGANKCTTRCDGCNQFLLARSEDLAEIIVEVDEDCRDNSSVVAYTTIRLIL